MNLLEERRSDFGVSRDMDTSITTYRNPSTFQVRKSVMSGLCGAVSVVPETPNKTVSEAIRPHVTAFRGSLVLTTEVAGSRPKVSTPPQPAKQA